MCRRCCSFMVLLLCVSAVAGCGGRADQTEVIEHTDYSPPKPADDGLTDDRLEDKRTTFDPALVDRRPLEGWQINQSEAVTRLDVPLVMPDQERELLVLSPSYRAALRTAQLGRR